MSKEPQSLPREWRILRHEPESAAWNMAVDEALARCRLEGQGVFRIYRWARPSLSFGRNQPVKKTYDPEAFASLGAESVRRPTGGREVLHDRELTYSLVLPLRTPGGLREVYRLVNEALVQALQSLGVVAGLARARGRTPPLDSGACFREPAAGEVEVAGRKLVGSAQVRMGDTLLQHGSLLLAEPSIRLASLATAGNGEGTDREQEGITLSELLAGPISFPEIAATVEAGIAGTLGGRWNRGRLTPREVQKAEELVERYRSAEWTWRR